MADYQNRFLEIHGPNMWNYFHVRRAVQFAKKYNLNGLIFHCNELLDRLVLPSKYFSQGISLDRWPVRDATLVNNAYYMKSVIKLCQDNGLTFFPEVKELYYPGELIEVFPHLREKNGAICPTDPFWWEFLEEKVREFIEDILPEAGGIIVSPGTRESMVSLAANGCTCERCKNYDMNLWYEQLIRAMYKPLAKNGKKLVVRDFSYTADHQFAMMDAAFRVSDKIALAIKKAPHDYYPTFPDNPAVGHTKAEQWIEFDTWGQYFGLGLFPCSIAEDMQGRLQRYLKKGASCVMLRTDWEILSQGSVFNSFNLFNLIAGAKLSENVNADLKEIYRAWVKEGLYSPLIHDSVDQSPGIPGDTEKAAETLSKFMQLSWQIIEKTVYIRKHVFQENCQFHDTVDLVFKMMLDFHPMDDWDPGAHLLVEVTDENIQAIFKEKEEALEMVKQIPALLDMRMELPDTISEYLKFLTAAYDLYVRVFTAITHTTYLVKKAEISKNTGEIKAALDTLGIFDSLSQEVKVLVHGKGYANEVEWCLDYKRLINFRFDAEHILTSISGGNK